MTTTSYVDYQDDNGWTVITYGSPGATLDIGTLFPNLPSTQAVTIINGGGPDIVTNTTSTQVTVLYEENINAQSLTAVAGATPGTLLIEDQNGTVDYTVTHNANGTYTVQEQNGVLVGTLNGVQSLDFYSNNGTMVTDQLVTTATYVPAGTAYRLPSTTLLQNAHNLPEINVTDASSGGVLDAVDVQTSLGRGPTVMTFNNTGGVDTIIDDTGTAATLVTYNESTGTFPTALHVVQGSTSATAYVEDQNGTIDYTINNLGNGSYSVTGAHGNSLGTVTGVPLLYFEVDGSGQTVPANITVSLAALPAYTVDSQGNYTVNSLYAGSSFEVGALTGAGSGNAVTILNQGVNNTVTNTSAATVSIVYTETAPTSTSLTAVAGATAGTLLIEDQNGTVDYSLTTNADGSYSIVGIGLNGAFGHKMGTVVSGVHDLQFEAGSASIDISLVGVPHVASA